MSWLIKRVVPLIWGAWLRVWPKARWRRLRNYTLERLPAFMV